MREIKFRAWDTVRKKYNREVHVDCYGGIVQFKFNGSSYNEVFDEQESKDRFIIEQYTGIKDRDGNEIYEGDIVQVKYKTTVWGNSVKYDFKGVVSLGEYELEIDESTYEDFLGWFIKIDNGSAEHFLKHISNLKIIGNIHENKGE